jgi:hypothetical protein
MGFLTLPRSRTHALIAFRGPGRGAEALRPFSRSGSCNTGSTNRTPSRQAATSCVLAPRPDHLPSPSDRKRYEGVDPTRRTHSRGSCRAPVSFRRTSWSRPGCHVQQPDQYMWAPSCSFGRVEARARGHGVVASAERGFAESTPVPPKRWVVSCATRGPDQRRGAVSAAVSGHRSAGILALSIDSVAFCGSFPPAEAGGEQHRFLRRQASGAGALWPSIVGTSRLRGDPKASTSRVAVRRPRTPAVPCGVVGTGQFRPACSGARS